MIERLGKEHFSDLYSLLRPYYDETYAINQDNPFSPENSANYLMQALSADHVYVLAARQDGKLVGCLFLELCIEFRLYPEAYIPIMMVSADARGSGAGRELVAAAMEIITANNVKAASTAAAGNLAADNRAKYDNLFSKFGFNKVSNVLMWGA